MRYIVPLRALVVAWLLLGSDVAPAQCTACDGDLNGDDQVTVDELVKAVNHALSGCRDLIACTGDGDCDADELCADGTCIGRPDPCTSDADCDSDESCVSGNCQ